MNALGSMLVKDFRLLVRDRLAFFFTFFFPLIMAVFFGTIFSTGSITDTTLKIIVVDQDHSASSASFVKSLEAASELSVERRDDAAAATDAIRSGKGGFAAMVRLPEGFGEASDRMFYGDPATIYVTTDPSRRAEAGMLEGLLTKYAFMRFQTMFTDPASMRPKVQTALGEAMKSPDIDPAMKDALGAFLPQLDTFLKDVPASGAPADAGNPAPAGGAATWTPIKIESGTVQTAPRNGPTNSYAVSFPQGIMWGVIGCCLSLGLTIVTERTRGTLVRLRMSPLSQTRLLAGKGLACFVLTVCVAAGLLLIARFVPPFHVVPTSVPLLVLVIACIGVCFTGLMMMLAVIGKSEQSAAGLGWGVMLMFSMLGGGMVPQFVMPGWMKSLGSISPVKWAMQALDGAIWRNATFAELALPCGILLAIGAATFFLGTRLFRWAQA
ncbi:MAG: ABC transporter permease [Phycisphaerales bacterium]